jgi:hypothetical protein
MPLKIDPAAQREADDAALWYEQQETGLAWKFFDVYSSALQAIERNPGSSPILEAIDSLEFRYCLLKSYAYRIGFRVCGDEVLVFGVGYVRRDSAYWARRLRQSGG